MRKSKPSKKLIEQTDKLLSQHYGFTFIGTEFYVIEFDDETKRLSKALFVSHAKQMIGSEAHDLIVDWFESKKAQVTKKLLDYLDKLDKNDRGGSNKILFRMLQDFDGDPMITSEMIVAFLESYYTTNILEKILEEKFNELDPSTVTPEDFNDIKKHLQATETEKIYELAKKKLNDWYSKTVVGDKLEDLFSQFVITLGKTDWKVTWVGHGPVTEEKILKHLRLDTNAHNEYVLNQYQEWFEQAVIDASEKEMNNAHNFELWNKIQRGELKLNTKAIDDLDD